MITAVFESFRANSSDWSGSFGDPVASQFVFHLDEVLPALHVAEQAALSGYWVAVTISYEAAPVFDRALKAHLPTAFPLVCTLIFDRNDVPLARQSKAQAAYEASAWIPQIARRKYDEDISSVLSYIAGGDTYQVNYTFPLRSEFAGSAWGWYRDLCLTQRSGFCAYIDLGRYHILSLSPELFFRRTGNELVTRPMKGTMARGRWLEEDKVRANELQSSEKNRAENIMITDLLRNDLGKISVPGSVVVEELCRVEKYETLCQMTSTISSEGRPGVDLVGIFRALFPCGSITGAPKVRTMEIINQLETYPRGIYTGAIGLLKPGGDCIFSVAIRTILLDTKTGEATFGVGGGITAGSCSDGEFDETVLKASFLNHRRPEFHLLETLLLEDGQYFLLERHVERMSTSAQYFGFEWNQLAVRLSLEKIRMVHLLGSWKIRLLAGRDGEIETEVSQLDLFSGQTPPLLPRGNVAADQINRRDPGSAETARRIEAQSSTQQRNSSIMAVAFASTAVDSNDPFLFHKTTNRSVYETALRSQPDCDDVILWNENGEVTESTIANVVVEFDRIKYTPPRTSGLLAGTFRDELLRAGEITERVVHKEELARLQYCWLINSVRKWIPAVLVEQS